MSKIVVIGEKEHILPYQSIGVGIEPVKTVTETVSILRKTAGDSLIEIILITESMAEQCLGMIAELRSKTAKVITIIPAQQGSRHTSTMELNKEIARAVGMDIFANE